MKIGKNNIKIIRGFLLIGAFVLIGKVAGAAKEMAVAWRYGVSEVVDSYAYVFNLMTWPIAIWFGVLASVFVPVVYKHKKINESDLILFRKEFFGFSLATSVMLPVAIFILLNATEYFGAYYGCCEGHESHYIFARQMILLLPFGILGGFFSAWLMSCGKNKNTLLEAIPALIIFIVIVSPIKWWGQPLVWSTVLGYCVQMLLLGWFVWKTQEMQWPVFSIKSNIWVEIWKGFGIMVFGQFLGGLTGVFDQIIANKIGDGSVSVIGYSNRILALVMGLGAMAISRSTLPVFSEMRANGDDTNKAMMRWAFLMFFMGVLTVIILGNLSKELVGIVYQRGEFSEEDTKRVAEIFKGSLTQVPFYFSSLVMVSYLAAHQKYKLIAISGGVNLLIKLLAWYFLFEENGLVGLVYTTSTMYAFSMVQLYLMTKKWR